MKNNLLEEAIIKRYIEPLKENHERFIGLEIEMPIVNLNHEATDQKIAQRVFMKFLDHFKFIPEKHDYNGICYSAISKETGDKISFDCSYNVLELSLGKETNLHILQKRFETYVRYLNQHFKENKHLLTGLGINPNFNINNPEYIPCDRYKMHEYFISKAPEWNYKKYFHPYYNFLTFTSSSQVHLDVTEEELLDTLKAFSLVEPIEAVLFSNSIMSSEPDLKCVRDVLWEDSTHGINPHNVGMYEDAFKSIEELVNYISTMSIFTVIRRNHTIFFKPIILNDYFNLDSINGEYYDFDLKKIVKTEFTPEIDDLKHVRTYKLEDLTFRGTLEFRSCCSQPFSEIMTVAAFHTGLQRKVPELLKLLENDNALYGNGYNSSELRALLNKKSFPSFIDHEKLKELIKKVLNLAKEGLLERELGEEIYLEPLYKRAQHLTSPSDYVSKQIENNNINYVIEKFSDFSNTNPLELE